MEESIKLAETLRDALYLSMAVLHKQKLLAIPDEVKETLSLERIEKAIKAITIQDRNEN